MPPKKTPVLLESFNCELEEKLQNEKRSKKTAHQYVNDINKIARDIGLQSESNLRFIVKHYSRIIEYIEKYDPHNRKRFISALIGALSLEKGKYYEKTKNDMNERMKNYMKEASDVELEQKKSDKQKEKWSDHGDWDIILSKMDQLYDKYTKLNPESSGEKQDLIDYVILSLYIYQPPRRLEYSKVKIITNHDQAMDETYNYYNQTNGEFIFNEYKTSKTYGKYCMKVSFKLKKLLENYFQFNDSGYLVISKTKKVQKGGSTLENIIIRASEKFLNKRYTVNDYRHMFIEHYIHMHPSITLKERKQIADKMGHNIIMNEKYRKIGM